MKTSEEIRIEKVLEVMAGLELGDSQMDLIEDYMTGNKETKALSALPFLDLSKQAPGTEQKIKSLFDEFYKRGSQEELNRLFEVVFQIGQSTCTSIHIFPYDFQSARIDTAVQTEQEKKVMVLAEKIAMDHHWRSQPLLLGLVNVTKKDYEIVEKALGYAKSEASNSQILLLTLYLYLKYHDFKKKIKKEDEEKLATLEGLLYRNITTLFGDKLASQDLERLQEYVQNKENDEKDLSDDLKKIVRAYTISKPIHNLLCGCAFLNYQLSPFFRNFIKMCLSYDMEQTLSIMNDYDLANDLAVRGGDFNILFHIDTKAYILWAARYNHRNILRYQLKHNRQEYLNSVEWSSIAESGCLMAVVKEVDKALFQEFYTNNISSQREKVIQAIVPSQKPSSPDVCRYLRGEAAVETIYPWRDDLKEVYCYGKPMRSAMKQYENIYGRDDFYYKCVIVLFFRNIYNFYYAIHENYKEIEKCTKTMFEGFQKEGLSLAYQLECAQAVYEEMYGDSNKQAFIQAVLPVFEKYLTDNRAETLAAMKASGATERYIAVSVLGRNPKLNKEDLFEFCQDTSKLVKEALISELRKYPEWMEDFFQLLKSKKSAEREIAIRVLRYFEKDTYSQAMKEALETEKSSKLKNLLKEILQIEDEETQAESKTGTDLVKELHKGGKKRALAWAYETPFSVVHMKNGEEAGEEYLQAVLLCYSTMRLPGVNQEVLGLTDQLDERELNLYMNELFDKWLEAGAESKKKWVLYAASIHGGTDLVVKLTHHINEWPKHARGSIAAEAVKALALSSSPTALLVVDGISRKFKFKQIKAAAGAALEFAASQLGLGKEELADKIVPDLGFNDNMERIFDYGERKFTVMINPALEIEIYDENKKKIKNMPAPGKRDDEAKANEAYAEFKQLKKQMKTTVANQKMRLEQALSEERKWTVKNWTSLFVKNPVMHQFAISLIWGIYEDGKLKATFRYMEDGTFNTEDEEEYTLPEDGQIGLVHPIELTEELKETWQEQLNDYEVVQSVEQLNRPVYRITEEEKNQKHLERFAGMIMNDLSLAGKLAALGWYRGSVLDAGGFDTYYREDAALNIGVELHFSGSYVGGMDEEITIYEASFYQAETIKRGSYVYDEVTQEKAYTLSQIPPRYFSEIVYQLTKATKSSKERIENWKKRR